MAKPVSQVLQNLVGNAVNFTENERIVIKLTPGQRHRQDVGGSGLSRAVTDPFQEEHALTTQPFQGVKALVCDDDELNQKIIARLLAKYGVEAETASNGLEGLTKLSEQSYDIAFIDLQMPILDGQQMAKMVRENRDPRIATTPLIAVTGAAHFFQNTPLAQTAFNDFIVKPITPHLILHSLKRSLQKK